MSRTRCLLVWLAASSVAGGGAAALVPALSRPIVDVETLVERICEVALLSCLGWAWFTTGVVAADAARGFEVRAGVPRWLARPVLIACGVVATSGLVVPAHAADGDAAGQLAGLRLPDRATTSERIARIILRAERDRPAVVVTVRGGDTLWGLAQEHGTTWPALYRANRDVVGDDPDLILPGQRLRLPTR